MKARNSIFQVSLDGSLGSASSPEAAVTTFNPTDFDPSGQINWNKLRSIDVRTLTTIAPNMPTMQSL